jgi:hypothetical protein
MTVDKLFDILPDGFLLVESDVLIKADITTMWREEYSFTAYVQRQQRGNKFGMGRILPMLCYLNVPKFKAEGVRYFDPDRSWMLHPDENDKRNWYDTGASLLEDVLAHRPRLKGLHVDIRPMVEHLGGASYRTLKGQAEWLSKHRELWEKKDVEAAMREVEENAKAFTEAHKGETAEEILAQMRGEKPEKTGKAQTSAIRHQTSPSKPKTAKRTNSKKE